LLGCILVCDCERVLRDNEITRVAAVDLVPGDVVLLEPGTAHGDMFLLQGGNISVDESALTGEGTPMIKKTPDFSDETAKYHPKRHADSTIAAGTQILEFDENTIPSALVMKTGSLTAKGKLLTSVFSQRRKTFLFDEEGQVVFLLLLVQAAVMISLAFYWLRDQLVIAWFYGTLDTASAPQSMSSVLTSSLKLNRSIYSTRPVSAADPDRLRGCRWNFLAKASSKNCFVQATRKSPGRGKR
jgi:magnesium-transporting ATPase (P-type)